MLSKVGVKLQASLMSPPLDFSFKKLSSENDILKLRPRKNRIGRFPSIGPNNKYIASAVWLSNNSIPTTGGAAAILNSILEDPINLAWLDLSFNEIYDIDELILQFSNLKILYLHGNKIKNISTVTILKALPKLLTLTLHGNPIDSIPQYRNHIIKMLPQINSLDFSPVVESERKGVPPLGFLEEIKGVKKKSIK